MRIAIHQPNFIPWFPFFYKMAMADKFVILDNVQFEKNGFQNRYSIADLWVTKAVQNGTEFIKEKKYASGRSLTELNMQWIKAIKDTLEITTELAKPRTFMPHETATNKLITEIKFQYGDIYITNPEAKSKYLDEDLIRKEGIEIEYCNVPRHLRKHTFEIFEEYGIEGAIKQLPRRKDAES